ncbi:MAG: DUF2029 domain-containing protein [Parafilimonas terrae]|nr:DUF2029 domain-containing protein [Parafilimonas terrae]
MPISPLSPRDRAVLATGAVLSLTAWLAMCPWNIHGWMIGAPLGRDFVNFWMAPRLVLAGQGAVLVDLPAYAATIKAAFGMNRDPLLLFVYPPHTLLFLTPFAELPFLPAVLVWTAVNLAGLVLAMRLILQRAPGIGLSLIVCLSPPAVAMMMYGHFGGLLALATTVVLFEAGRRPVVSGFCLAFLSVKPQFACALGLMLFGAGFWRCLVAGAVATSLLAALSVCVFGVEVWERFITVTMPMQSAFVTAFDARMIETSVTAYFAARYSGLPAAAAWTIQTGVSLFALWAGIKALRRDIRAPGAVAVVILAALVMQPYASHYDLAIAAPALALMLFGPAAAAAPVTVAAWLLTPLARILIVFDLPVLGVLVPAALVVQALRLLGRERAAAPGRLTAEPAL